jgi:hypothetical protein
LDPRRDSWGRYFTITEDRMLALGSDRDAEYTCEAYDLADERKTICRRSRAQALSSALETIREVPSLEQELLRRASLVLEPERATLITAARELRARLHDARELLSRYTAIAHDAEDCRCQAPKALPRWLAEQVMTVEM